MKGLEGSESGEKRGGRKLGGVEGGETVVGMFCVREASILNKKESSVGNVYPRFKGLIQIAFQVFFTSGLPGSTLGSGCCSFWTFLLPCLSFNLHRLQPTKYPGSSFTLSLLIKSGKVWHWDSKECQRAMAGMSQKNKSREGSAVWPAAKVISWRPVIIAVYLWDPSGFSFPFCHSLLLSS